MVSWRIGSTRPAVRLTALAVPPAPPAAQVEQQMRGPRPRSFGSVEATLWIRLGLGSLLELYQIKRRAFLALKMLDDSEEDVSLFSHVQVCTCPINVSHAMPIGMWRKNHLSERSGISAHPHRWSPRRATPRFEPSDREAASTGGIRALSILFPVAVEVHLWGHREVSGVTP